MGQGLASIGWRAKIAAIVATSFNPAIKFVPWPGALPNGAKLGRVALVDLAFAYGGRFETATKPFIEAAGEKLAMWIDHHPHPQWRHYLGDPRFVLVDKKDAPACPELVTPERVALLEARGLDTVLAHGDFDGCISAVKVLLRGSEPYPGADEDARAVDAPGRGFELSERGRRLANALAYAADALEMSDNVAFLGQVADALVSGAEPEALSLAIDSYAREAECAFEAAKRWVKNAEVPHPGLIVLRLGLRLPRNVKKSVLQTLENRERIAIIDEDGFVTAATFHDGVVDLSTLPGLRGGEAYAWGTVDVDRVIDAIAAEHHAG